MFTRLELHDWRQFETVDIRFHDSLTVLTGANGAGKTTILNTLSRHFGWGISLIATPSKLKKQGVLRYLSGVGPSDEGAGRVEVGSIQYSSGVQAKLWVPQELNGASFSLDIEGQQPLPGMYVPSHRPPYTYAQVSTIPTNMSARDELIRLYVNDLMQHFNPRSNVQSPSFRLKEALIALATFGEGNSRVEGNESMIETLTGFEEILSKVLPRTLGFRRLRVRIPEVVLETVGGDVSLDAVSGGIAAIIDLAWQTHMYALIHESFVVVIDEPENHLHPTLQRTLLGDFLSAFPQAQFVVASHNPFIVTSVPDSNVYVLEYNSRGKVTSTFLDMVNRAGTSNEILRDVLGVEATLPVWVEDRLQGLVAEFRSQPLTDESVAILRDRLSQVGMDHLFPETLDQALGEMQ